MVWFGFSQTPSGSPPPEDPVRDEPTAGDEASDMLLSLLPWAISILLHVGIVLLAVFVVWSVQKQVSEEEVIIPIARLSATPGAPLTQQQTKTLTQSTTSMTRRSLATAASTPARTALASKVSQDSISIGAQMSMSQSNPFTAGVSAGAGLKAQFFGTGGNATRIGYLVDASGSLIDTLPFVIMELKRSIGELSERQSFTVIFFQGEDAIEVPPRSWKQANSTNKQRVMQWLDEGNIVPMGLSNPVKALRIILQYRPQLLFLLSDNITGEGRYEVDQRRLLAEITDANRGGTKINTIQFLYQDKLVDYGLEPSLKLISDGTGGIYKFLDARELGIQ